MFTALSTINLPLSDLGGSRLDYRMTKTPASPLAERIIRRLKATGQTARSTSLAIGSDSFVRNILNGKSKSPRAENLAQLALALNTTTSWLLTGEGPEVVDDNSRERTNPSQPAPNASFPPRYERFPDSTVPLLGQTVGGPNGRFILNGQKVADVFCPPALAGVEGAYAVQVYGTSMEPKFEAGETVWLHPTSPVRSGDYVVVQLLTNEDDAPESYIKQFVSRSSKSLKLRQFNPEEGDEHELEFDNSRVFTVHKIVFHALV